MNLKHQNLAFFLTRKMSLKKWAESGVLQREVALYNLLAKKFKKIYLFTYGDCTELRYQKSLASNIKIIFRNSNSPAFLYSLLIPCYHWRILRCCSFFKSNQLDGAWSALLSKSINRKAKFILRTGFTWSRFLGQENKLAYFLVSLIEFWLYRSCDLALVSSQSDKKYLQKKYHLQAGKIKVLSNYVDTDIFKPLPQVLKARKRIIFVGRLHKQKNLFNLIKALKGTGIQLDMIGQGKLRTELEKFALESEVKVRFLGSVANPKLPLYLNRYPVFVLPSLYEGMPKSLLEAMACGLACIATRVPGPQELIIPQKTGLLTEPDHYSLKRSICNLIQDQKLQREIGQRACDFISQNYSLTRLAQQEIKIYEALV